MRYGTFASEFGWDEKIVDRNTSSYLAGMYAYVGAKGMATGAYSDTERAALAKENDAEDATTRGKSLEEIRNIDPFRFEFLTDDELKREIKRGQRKPLEG